MPAESAGVDEAAASPLAVADAAPDSTADADALGSLWPSSCGSVSLAKVYAFAASGVALMPVPLVHADGVSGSVEVNVMSAH